MRVLVTMPKRPVRYDACVYAKTREWLGNGNVVYKNQLRSCDVGPLFVLGRRTTRRIARRRVRVCLLKGRNESGSLLKRRSCPRNGRALRSEKIKATIKTSRRRRCEKERKMRKSKRLSLSHFFSLVCKVEKKSLGTLSIRTWGAAYRHDCMYYIGTLFSTSLP